MLPLLLLAFILVPVAELALIIAMGGEIGWLWTVALLLADAVLGSLLVRWQGRTAWLRFTAAIQAGRPPAREVIDGAFVLVGGALLLAPGFFTDALGLALLAPPSRAVLRRLVARRILARMTAQMAGGARGRAPGGRDDVEGTAREIDDPRLEAPR